MICAAATARYPAGRSGTDAGYQAHRRAGEVPCGPCQEFHIAKGRLRWESLDGDELARRREENRLESARFRVNNPAAAAAAKTTFMELNRELIRAAKACPCTDCGVQYPYWVMQFDHIGNNKAFNIGVIGPTASRARVRAEIAKCEVVCANCHAERTHRRRQETRGQDAV